MMIRRGLEIWVSCALESLVKYASNAPLFIANTRNIATEYVVSWWCLKEDDEGSV